MTQTTIHLGYEMNTGAPVSVPLNHLAVTGQTQMSGKTTTLEALITRSGRRAIVFKTKRGESSFADGHRIQPYFREGATEGRPFWEFVESLMASAMKKKMNFERAWTIRATEGAHTLKEVRVNIERLKGTAKRGMDEDLYMLLGEYLDIVIPQIERLPRSSKISLRDGLNVMDLTAYTEEMQMLVIRSVVEWIHEHEEGVITVMPEAWKFIPESRMTPVKLAAERLIREGAGLRNFIWMDSQDIAGIWKTMLRAATVWIVGVQREQNEVKRTLANIPEDTEKPKAAQVMKLGRGQFFACFGETIKHVYVQPAWLNEAQARAVALGSITADVAAEQKPQPKRKEETPAMVTHDDSLSPGLISALVERLAELTGAVEELSAQLAREGRNAARPVASAAPDKSKPAPAAPVDVEAIVKEVIKRLPKMPAATGDTSTLALSETVYEVEVRKRREVIKMDADTLPGRIAVLLHEGFFDDAPKGATVVWKEVQRRGFTGANNVQRELVKLAEKGFLTRESGEGFKAVVGMKVNIIEE